MSILACGECDEGKEGVISARVFFFQAEDGIRDLVRSRGLGDVYKRQLLLIAVAGAAGFILLLRWPGLGLVGLIAAAMIVPFEIGTLSLIHI